MCKWRKIFNTFLFGTLLLSAAGRAQEERLFRADQLYRAKQSELALQVIDSAAAHPQTSADFITWTTRAFIYYDLLKRSGKSKQISPLRDSIVSSISRSNSLKPDSFYSHQNRVLLNTISASYFNIAKYYLVDSMDYQKSQQNYLEYKRLYATLEPGTDFTARDIEYNLAVGSHFLESFMKDTKKTEHGEVARLTLMKVLDLQPDNPSALVNMGLMYYNQAAELTKRIDYGIPFEEIDAVQENIVKLAKQAEGFIVRVYNKDNKNPKAVEGLFYIYRMLNEYQKSDEFRVKCKELGIVIEEVVNTK
jgi:hypothetical protein